MTTTKLPPFDDVFYSYQIKGLSGWDDLPLLGSLNLRELLKSLRSSEKGATKRIQDQYAERDRFRGKTGDHFKMLASDFENPEVELGPTTQWGGRDQREPIDAASIARAGGATTFNMCGWCSHTGGGSVRYSYYITTRCGLLPDEYTDDYVGVNQPETNDGATTTPCLLHQLTAEQCDAVADWREARANTALQDREEIRTAIKHVRRLLDNAHVEKPYIKALRPYAWFNVGDEIMFNLHRFAGPKADYAMTVDTRWAKGLVVPGYRHHDGGLSCAFEVQVHTNLDHHGGRGGSAGSSSAYVLKRTEYEYLKAAVESDPEFLKLWYACVKADHGNEDFDAEQYTKDLLSGSIAQKERTVA